MIDPIEILEKVYHEINLTIDFINNFFKNGVKIIRDMRGERVPVFVGAPTHRRDEIAFFCSTNKKNIVWVSLINKGRRCN
jgi:hypothetical protein